MTIQRGSTPGEAGKRPAGSDPAVVLREVEALRLRMNGLTLEQIAEATGYAHKSGPKRAIDRILGEIRFSAAEDYRQVQLARLEATLARVTEVLYDTHVHVNDGQIVTDPETGARLLDPMPNLAAARELRQLEDQIAKLLGTNAPTRRVVEVITDDMVNQAIAQELAAMEALDAGRSADREPATPA